MRNSTFKPKVALPPRRDRRDEFRNYVARPHAPAVATIAPPPAPRQLGSALQKVQGRVKQSIRDSARGEACQVRIVGACTHDPATTIWSHAPLGAAGKGRGIKAIDLAGAYCCTACDAVIDGQRPLPAGVTRQQAELDWFHGHLRSLVLLKQKGLA